MRTFKARKSKKLCLVLILALILTQFAGVLPALAIDSPAVINNVTSTKADGTYKTGDEIPVTVTVNKVVYVTGEPRILLATGVTERYATYIGGSSTNELIFKYTVQPGDKSSDLDYKSINALELNGGSIKDGAGQDADLKLPAPGNLGSLGDNKNFVIDETLKVVSTEPANGKLYIAVDKKITVNFSGSVQQGVYFSGITIKAGAAGIDFTSNINAGVLTLTPQNALAYDTQYTVSIPAGAVEDTAGNELAADYNFSFTTRSAISKVLDVGSDQPYKTIQAAVSKTNPGDTIRVHDGSYNEQVNVDEPDITIKSVNGAVYTGVYADGEHAFRVYAPGVTIEGFTITNDDGAGIYVNKENRGILNIRNNIITNNNAQGIFVEEVNGGNLSIKGNTVSGNDDDGIYVARVNLQGSVSIENNSVIENDCEGIYFEQIDNGIVNINNHNTFAGNECEALWFEEVLNGSTVSIKDNTISNGWDGGIFFDTIDNGSTVSVEDNTILDNECCDGIQIYNVGTGSNNNKTTVKIAGNTMGATADWENGTGYGISLYNIASDGVVNIEGNSIIGNKDAAIYIDHTQAGSKVTVGPDNVITNNLRAGIILENGTSGVRIWGNNIESNYDGIFIAGSDNTIVGNYVYDNYFNYEPYGTSIQPKNGGYYELRGVGIYLTGYAENNRINYNDITGNAFGLYRGYYYGEVPMSSRQSANRSDSSTRDKQNNGCEDINRHNKNSEAASAQYAVAGTNNTSDIYEDAYTDTDAKLNWWGDVTGPTVGTNVYGNGDGDRVNDNNEYNPWVTRAYFDPGALSLTNNSTSKLILMADTLTNEKTTGTVTVPLSLTEPVVRLTSSNPSVATIATDGTVTAVGLGTAEITAHFANKPKVLVTVTQPATNTGGTVSSGGSGSSGNPELPGSTIKIPGVAGPRNPFIDVPNDYWAVNEIVYLADQDIINGFPDNTYRPRKNITRGELAVIMAKALKLDQGSPDKGQFSDVDREHWAFKAIEATTKAGVMVGYANGEFRPDISIARQELVQVIIKALHYGKDKRQVVSAEILDRFKDKNEIAWWAKDAVAEAVSTDLAQGVKKDLFGPQIKGSRDQVAVLVYKLIKLRGTK